MSEDFRRFFQNMANRTGKDNDMKHLSLLEGGEIAIGEYQRDERDERSNQLSN